MNGSFRTAYWTLCLGLTIPMLLFVAVELTTGEGETAREVAAGKEGTASDRRSGEALLSESRRKGSRKVSSRRSGSRAPVELVPELGDDGGESPVRLGSPMPLGDFRGELTAEAGARTGPPRVVLGPQVETSQAAPELTISVEPLPSEPAGKVGVPARTVSRSQIDAASISSPVIEDHLTHIRRNLDQLVEVVTEQAHRQPPDPVEKLNELLEQIRKFQTPVESAPAVNELPPPATLEKSTGRQIDTSKVRDAEPLRLPEKPLSVARPATPKLFTKMYRPRHIDVKSLESVVQAVLTPGTGKIGAARSGERTADDAQGGGTDTPANWDALVVRDTTEVLRKVDRLVQELDVSPPQILIEATIVSVRLPGNTTFGIDLSEFNSTGQSFVMASADAATLGSTTGSKSSLMTHGAGMKCGVLRGDVRSFLQALQAAHQTTSASAFQMSVRNKQSADLALGDSAAYGGSGSAGTLLKVRPLVTRDGTIHLEVRPAGQTAGAGPGAAPNRTAGITNSVTVRDGETAVIGGILDDRMVTQMFRTSAAGDLPVVGKFFWKEGGVVERTETIVLLTPHVAYAPPPPIEGVQDTVRRKAAEGPQRRAAATVTNQGPRAPSTASQQAPANEPAVKKPAETVVAEKIASPARPSTVPEPLKPIPVDSAPVLRSPTAEVGKASTAARKPESKATKALSLPEPAKLPVEELPAPGNEVREIKSIPDAVPSGPIFLQQSYVKPIPELDGIPALDKNPDSIYGPKITPGKK